SGLSSAALQAHVHFGQPNVNGGVVFFFCGGGSKPACPAGATTPATGNGTIAASDILAPPPSQGLTPGGPTGRIQEIRGGFAYANVHTMPNPGGEIRGQLFPAGHHDHDNGQGENDDD